MHDQDGRVFSCPAIFPVASGKFWSYTFPMPLPPVSLDGKNPDHVAMAEAIRQQSILRVEKLLLAGVPANAYNLDRQISHLTGGVSWLRAHGQTLLLTALSRKNLDLVALLLRYGADPDAAPAHAPGLEGQVSRHYLGGALHAALRLDLPEAFALLLGHGASIELPDRDGWTPLCWAAWYGRLPEAVELLRHGAVEHLVVRRWEQCDEDIPPPWQPVYWEDLRPPASTEVQERWNRELSALRLEFLPAPATTRERGRL